MIMYILCIVTVTWQGVPVTGPLLIYHSEIPDTANGNGLICSHPIRTARLFLSTISMILLSLSTALSYCPGHLYTTALSTAVPIILLSTTAPIYCCPYLLLPLSYLLSLSTAANCVLGCEVGRFSDTTLTLVKKKSQYWNETSLI